MGVIPDTIGQYTGLTDKNGKRIFEGDIVKHYIKNSEIVKIYIVEWENRLSKFVGRYKGDEYYGKKYAYAELHEQLTYEVISNIHDNPELLGNASQSDAADIAQEVLKPATPENFELMPG